MCLHLDTNEYVNINLTALHFGKSDTCIQISYFPKFFDSFSISPLYIYIKCIWKGVEDKLNAALIIIEIESISVQLTRTENGIYWSCQTTKMKKISFIVII